MFLNQGNKIGWCVSRQRGFCEVRVRGQEVIRPAVKIGKITAPAAGDQYFLAGALCALNQRNEAAALAGFDRAHEAGCTSADNYSIEFADHLWFVRVVHAGCESAIAKAATVL